LYEKDSVTGLLLAGIGHVNGPKKNFLVVDSSKLFWLDYLFYFVSDKKKTRITIYVIFI
jgi:hypothetical protein